MQHDEDEYSQALTSIKSSLLSESPVMGSRPFSSEEGKGSEGGKENENEGQLNSSFNSYKTSHLRAPKGSRRL